MFKKAWPFYLSFTFALLFLTFLDTASAQSSCCYTRNEYQYTTQTNYSRYYTTRGNYRYYYVRRRTPSRYYVVVDNPRNSCTRRTTTTCLPFSIPYNIPDGWLLSHMGIDPQGRSLRTFQFKDLTNECRYSIKTSETYHAWCMDQNLMAVPNIDYMTRLFNFFQALPDYGQFETPKGDVTIFDFFYKDYDGNYIPFDKILYILNNKEGYTMAEVQEAIWYYTMGEQYVHTSTTRYKELVEAAEMYGDNYIPPCDGTGKLFMFALTKSAQEDSQVQACQLGQPFVVEMPVPQWMCEYGVLDDLLEKIYSSYENFLNQDQGQNQNQDP